MGFVILTDRSRGDRGQQRQRRARTLAMRRAGVEVRHFEAQN